MPRKTSPHMPPPLHRLLKYLSVEQDDLCTFSIDVNQKKDDGTVVPRKAVFATSADDMPLDVRPGFSSGVYP